MGSVLDRVYSNLKERGSEPQVHIQQHVRVGDAFKVIAATHGVDGESDMVEAIATMTGGAGRVVPGSFRRRGGLCVAFVAANAQSRPLDASFQLLTASTALAADGGIWSVVDEGGAKRVVLESHDDLAGILATRQANRKVHANPVEGAGLAVAHVASGDLVRYYDSASRSCTWGMAFATDSGLQVIGRDLAPRTILPAAVVASVPRAQVPEANKVPCTAKLDPAGLNRVLDYLKRAWAPVPEADKMLEGYRRMAENAK